ncbi:hypothetical protein [Bradyrhizobium erythrophlei]|nr:hypothetical protein [Bradyrhizobium erythrophlei]
MNLKLLAAWVVATIVSSAIGASAEQPRSARIVTSSEDLQITKADHTIGLKREVNPHKTVLTLPPDAEPDQEFIIDDLVGNFRTISVTVRAPGGHMILNRRTLWVLDSNHVAFRYFGEKLWSVEP